MIPIIIGIAGGLLVILTFILLKQFDKPVAYGLILAGIGFLYPGFTWSDTTALIITSVQAIVFLFLAASGIRRSLYILGAGYFLHGLWDLGYNLLPGAHLVPPHYDLFCLSIDFTIGAYLIFIGARKARYNYGS